jgi:hypothetical protein
MRKPRQRKLVRIGDLLCHDHAAVPFHGWQTSVPDHLDVPVHVHVHVPGHGHGHGHDELK